MPTSDFSPPHPLPITTISTDMASSSHDAPATPVKQRALSRLSMDSPSLDDIDCSPKTKAEMNNLKRKASQLIDEGSPSLTAPFLKWRLAVVDSKLSYREKQRAAIAEARSFFEEVRKPQEEYMAEVEADEKELRFEKKLLLSQRKTLEEDLTDTLTETGHLNQAYVEELQDAYIKEMRMSLDAASTSKTKIPGLKAPRSDRKEFSNIVNEHLAAYKEYEDTGDEQKWCNVLGYWLSPGSVKCAYLVPFSWNLKSTAHMFGSDEPPRTSKRNGLSLQTKIEEAFDNCWVVIVPAESIDVTPTQWKIVLLNTAVKDDMFFRDLTKATGQDLWRWRDIDGRRLQFRNDNRPARRFLYMRYVLAWLHAETKGWPNFKSKVPPGEVWATPSKPQGYLRKSILLEMGKMAGDKLPKDLIEAGVFEDPSTSSTVQDQVAGITIAEHVQDHLKGKRDSKEEGSSVED